jgi:heat shock protein HtpX
MIGWVVALAVVLAIAAAVLAYRSRDDDPSSVSHAVPYAVLMVAAALAAASTLADAAIDRRVGIREASTFALALLFGTPAVGWAVTHLRWGAPGSRTFHQQIAANQTASVVLVLILVELLALLGFVVGGTLLGWLIGVLPAGLLGAAITLVIGVTASLAAARRGPESILASVGAKPASRGHTVLDNVVTELSMAAGITKPAVYIIDAAAPNAFAIGMDPDHGTIAVTRGLLELLDREELQGVIAHEIAHLRNLDSRYGLLVAIIVGTVVLVAAAFAAMLSSGSIDGGGGIAGFFISIVIVVLLALLGFAVKVMATAAAKALQASVSREREFLADATSVQLTRNPAGLIRALDLITTQPRLTSTNEGVQHLWFVASQGHPEDELDEEGWFETHPAPAQRIARLRELETQLDATAEAAGTNQPGSSPQ